MILKETLEPKPGDLVFYVVRNSNEDYIDIEERLGLFIGAASTRGLVQIQPIGDDELIVVYPTSIVKIVRYGEEKT